MRAREDYDVRVRAPTLGARFFCWVFLAIPVCMSCSIPIWWDSPHSTYWRRGILQACRNAWRPELEEVAEKVNGAFGPGLVGGGLAPQGAGEVAVELATTGAVLDAQPGDLGQRGVVAVVLIEGG